ncbi:D-alanyl-D-alanine carboxypeptidase/D-alanyl-D-alanine-endopeptidase [Leptolyngbya cf. ectocarpi LEGE 11479]|uniref:D-alanyl-D-alanine carboxypeptidase/D-alanyl-D-alanine-endopeptidase n=1 Tax=Leptolyngbya cf. ectocarpi LEGE 11479 TaxID=1828722 RepID=A0A929FBV6_LEPEC|nr:D-alanyl-D-alanine carboxypeptidase/D-alanyl-D-alanine-endopeptidase [Leptolyngbya ectocarpi]MBE9069472.1 D-alanyl-D-alanine carboxypeptidase/D-alanyl-D-alanine-endopeptidase [Leptolyngbya cf. ectocarpi LEGE 11479]
MNCFKPWIPLIALFTALLPTASASAYCRADLAREVNKIAAQPALKKARLGVLIETQTGQVIYSRDADRYFVPASNVKLLTTAAALSSLGPNFTIRTSVYDQPQTNSVQVVGRGDPTVSDDQLNELAGQLKTKGISNISNLLGNDSYFSGPAVNPNWEWEDVQAGYGAPANSLIINANELGFTLYPQTVGQPLRVEWDDPSLSSQWQIENFSRSVAENQPEYIDIGRDLSRPILRVYGQLIAGAAPDTASVAVPNPADYFISRFRQTLTRQGITVAQSGLTTAAANGSELAAITSPPLAQWMVRTNRNSKNIYAEAMLKSLGARTAEDATAAGVEALETILQRLGVNPELYEIVDGSGLSRHNLATPQAFVDTLQAMAQSPHADTYRNSLAVAGTNGTLRNRLGSIRFVGKTGAVSHNASLSGYLNPHSHDPLVLSILINNLDQRGSTLRRILDDIVKVTAQLEDC